MGYFSEMSIDMQKPMAQDAKESQPLSLEPPEYEDVAPAAPATVITSAQEPLTDDQEMVEEARLIEEQSKPIGADQLEAEAPESSDAEEEKKRAEHEATEAKRKAEWEAKQQAKKAAEQEQLDLLAAMSDDEVMMASMKRVSTETERLTRRNMKECVSEYIQTRCLEDMALARLAMHPHKSMINCFHYINRKAREYLQQEIKDNDVKPENGVYGGDVPDELCYQWAEEYFRDADAPEDKKEEEKFVPKPYIGKYKPKSNPKKAAEKKKSEPKQEKKKPADNGQLAFEGQLSLGDFALPDAKAS